MRSIVQFRSLGPLIAALLVSVAVVKGQSLLKPYAAIDHDAVSYAGPGRDTGHDLDGPVVKIGFLAPLGGPRRSEGHALLEAAQMALEDEAASPLPEGRRLALATGDESGPWGRVSSEIVRLIYDDESVALITSAEGGSAHLAEQVGNKIGVPILTLSTDDSTTQINLPWIFRLGPSDAIQAKLIAEDIYKVRRLKKIILVAEDNHDGRVGGEEFAKAARRCAASEPETPGITRMVAGSPLLNADAFLRELLSRNPEAVVFWTSGETTAVLLRRLRLEAPSLPIYICRKAAQELAETSSERKCVDCSNNLARNLESNNSGPDENSLKSEVGGIWVVASGAGDVSAQTTFDRHYEDRTGTPPSLASRQSYDAVRIIAHALRQSGANRVRLRDSLAEISSYTGASGIITFDHAGNDLSPASLIRLSD